MTVCQARVKRSMDIVLSTLGLVVFGWLIAVTYVLAAIDTGASGFFTQERVGRHGRRFRVVKLRTMNDCPAITTTVTTSDDPRISRLGRLFRRYKIDELPQLFNVLKGDMSFVGPRPDVPGFADVLEGQDLLVLSVRPGITGPGTLRFRDEESLLRDCDDPERYNSEVIFPEKVRLNLEYIRNYSLRDDVKMIWRTIFPS